MAELANFSWQEAKQAVDSQRSRIQSRIKLGDCSSWDELQLRASVANVPRADYAENVAKQPL